MLSLSPSFSHALLPEFENSSSWLLAPAQLARNRNLDEALGASKRSIWIATGVILLLGAVLLLWLVSPTERSRRAEVERLELGDPMGRVAGILGPPGTRCSGRDLAHLAGSFPPGWTAPSIETTLQALGEETGERWIYPLDEDDEAGCGPADGQTEVGLDGAGRLLWYVAITGESPLELPERFAPAATTP